MEILKSLVALAAIALLGYLTASVSADEWSTTYESLFGVTARSLSPIEAKKLLNKLGSSLATSSAAIEQKAEVEFWLKASEKPVKSQCSASYDKSLETKAVNHPALQEFSEDLQRKLYDFCMDEIGLHLKSSLREWSEKDSVIALADDIKYASDVPEDKARIRITKLIDRQGPWLRRYIFDSKESKEANYIKFKEHYRINVPCENYAYKKYTSESPQFLTYITRPKVYQKLDPDSVMIFRKVLVCQKYNELESVKRDVFEEIYNRVI